MRTIEPPISADPPEDPRVSAARARVISVRCIVVGLLLVIINDIWIVSMEHVVGGMYPTTVSLFMNAVFILLGLLVVNAGLSRWLPKAALSRQELLTIYAMVGVATAVAGLDMVPILPQIMADGTRFATPANRWAETFGQYLPHWLTVHNTSALQDYYAGNSSFWTTPHLRVWLPPLGAWLAFLAVLLWVMMCLNVMVRRQWGEREKLSFPLILLPLEMTRPDGGLFRQPLLWVGVAVAGGVDLLNGLAFVFPAWPSINIAGIDLAKNFTQRPWSAIWWMPLTFYPFAIGLGFLLPVDILFSCWFFYLYWKLQRVVFDSGGWSTGSAFPYINEQCFGAYAAIVLFSLWAGRSTYREVWRRAMGRASSIDDSREALSYRVALLGAAGGGAALVAFLDMAGMSLGIAILFVLIYFLLALAIARIRAELGPPVHDLHFTGPDHLLPTFFGSRELGSPTLTALSLTFWFNRAYRSHPMPVQTEALALAQRTNMEQRRMMVALMAAGIVGAATTMGAFLHWAYSLGAAAKMAQGNGFGSESYTRLSGWIRDPHGPNLGALTAAGVGFASGLALMALHVRVSGWPFHAIGYAISGSWSMNLFWCPLLIAWVLKATTLRYGGLRAYRTLLPFFFGLILGETIVGMGLGLLGTALGVRMYTVLG